MERRRRGEKAVLGQGRKEGDEIAKIAPQNCSSSSSSSAYLSYKREEEEEAEATRQRLPLGTEFAIYRRTKFIAWKAFASFVIQGKHWIFSTEIFLLCF